MENPEAKRPAGAPIQASRDGDKRMVVEVPVLSSPQRGGACLDPARDNTRGWAVS